MLKKNGSEKGTDMIIGNAPVSVSTGADATVAHFENGDQNESAECIVGSSVALHSMEADAKRFGHKYFARCFLANPFGNTTRKQFLEVILPTIVRYTKLPITEGVVYEHSRALKNGTAHRHWHIAWAHADPATGRVRQWSWSHITDELIGRTLEYELGEPILLGRFQDLVIAQMRANGDHKMADSVAAAHPPGAQPKARTAKRAVEQAAKARGIELRDVHDKVGTAYRAATDIDEFREKLAEHGLSLEISNRVRDRPAWVVHSGGRFVRSLCGALPRVPLATIIAKIGDPNDERTSSDERGQDVARTGSLSDKVSLDRGHDGGAGLVQPRTEQEDDGLAATTFIDALNTVSPNIIETLYQRALHLTRGALVKAREYFAGAQARAHEFLATAANIRPAPSAILLHIRREIRSLIAAEATAHNAWGEAKANLILLREAPTDEKNKDSLIKRKELEIVARKAAWLAAKQKVIARQEWAQPFEIAYEAAIARHQDTVVAKKITGARRWLRAVARCNALIEEKPAALTLGAPALFAKAVGEDERASPGARFLIAGTDEPDMAIDEDAPKWKR